MTQIDQFESIFRAASKTLFQYSDWDVKNVLTISDGTRNDATELESRVKQFVANAFDIGPVQWQVLQGDHFSSVSQLIEIVDEIQPDLICSHRNLQIPADEYPYSLGVYIDVLTQATTVPVMLLPNAKQTAVPAGNETTMGWHTESKTVIAITDHLDDDAMIVNAAIKMTSRDGTLFLAHVEDERAYLRFMHVIDKIAEIDSEIAHEKILERLLLEPHHFTDSCRTEIEEKDVKIRVEPIVKMGHSLSDYKELVETHNVDLVVIHTKDDDQLAMHGLAYPLTIELRDTPMLLI